MKMKKLSLVLAMIVLACAVAFGQQAAPQAQDLGQDTAQQALQEVSISRFEDPGFWKVTIPIDQGVITHRRLDGAPAGREPIQAEVDAGINPQDQYVLGVKTEFFPPRGMTNIFVEPRRPLPVPGIAKTISVWVVGRNFNHNLWVVVRNNAGQTSFLHLGKLNFSGWKKLTVAVPPNIKQRDPHYGYLSGIQIIGFMIVPDLLETYGSYYVYFDDLRVLTDLFAEQSRDPDDMVDSW